MQDMDEEKDESIESQCLSSSNWFSSNKKQYQHFISLLLSDRRAGLPLWKWQRMWQWHSFEASRAAMFHTSWQRIAILHFCEESEPLPTGKEKDSLISSAGRKEGSFWRRSQIPGEPMSMESTSSSQIAAEKNEENNSLLRFHSTSSKWFIEKCRWIRKRLKLRTRCRWYWHWGRQRRSRGTSRGTLQQGNA